MCLVISVLLTILSVNFYLNGFIPQSIMSALLALVLLYFMYKNITCKTGSCGIKKGKSTSDEKNDPDSEDHIQSDQQEAESK